MASLFPVHGRRWEIRLCSSVAPRMSFPSGFCSSSVLVCTRFTPFVFVCTLTPFGEYNNIRRREEYKSTKACKCAPSIVVGARWPNGITTARAAAAAMVRPTSKGKGAHLRACVCVCVFTKAFSLFVYRTGTLVSAGKQLLKAFGV